MSAKSHYRGRNNSNFYRDKYSNGDSRRQRYPNSRNHHHHQPPSRTNYHDDRYLEDKSIKNDRYPNDEMMENDRYSNGQSMKSDRYPNDPIDRYSNSNLTYREEFGRKVDEQFDIRQFDEERNVPVPFHLMDDRKRGDHSYHLHLNENKHMNDNGRHYTNSSYIEERKIRNFDGRTTSPNRDLELNKLLYPELVDERVKTPLYTKRHFEERYDEKNLEKRSRYQEEFPDYLTRPPHNDQEQSLNKNHSFNSFEPNQLRYPTTFPDVPPSTHSYNAPSLPISNNREINNFDGRRPGAPPPSQPPSDPRYLQPTSYDNQRYVPNNSTYSGTSSERQINTKNDYFQSQEYPAPFPSQQQQQQQLRTNEVVKEELYLENWSDVHLPNYDPYHFVNKGERIEINENDSLSLDFIMDQIMLWPRCQLVHLGIMRFDEFLTDHIALWLSTAFCHVISNKMTLAMRTNFVTVLTLAPHACTARCPLTGNTYRLLQLSSAEHGRPPRQPNIRSLAGAHGTDNRLNLLSILANQKKLDRNVYRAAISLIAKLVNSILPELDSSLPQQISMQQARKNDKKYNKDNKPHGKLNMPTVARL
ncbi:hypothetical protein SNEBB_011002 [Seison nebaliae]|nr:hypothetical protein SNEBB_011002 [Seison nebaliae]